jgi:hypothetical protein
VCPAVVGGQVESSRGRKTSCGCARGLSRAQFERAPCQTAPNSAKRVRTGSCPEEPSAVMPAAAPGTGVRSPTVRMSASRKNLSGSMWQINRTGAPRHAEDRERNRIECHSPGPSPPGEPIPWPRPAFDRWRAPDPTPRRCTHRVSGGGGTARRALPWIEVGCLVRCPAPKIRGSGSCEPLRSPRQSLLR